MRNLHKAAQVICDTYGGQMPADHAALLKLPGIGDYTAGAVASIAFDIAEPAVDGNVLRVVARLTGDERPIDDAKVKKDMRAQVAAIIPHDRPGAFNQAMMELGAVVCIPNGAPRCGDCPLMHLCHACHEQTTDRIPVRTPKKERTVVHRTVLLPRCGGLVGIRKRLDTGLLARMWELPAYEHPLEPSALRDQLAADGWKVERMLSLRPAKHIFTHIEWHMTGYYVELSEPVEDLTWVTPSALRGDYALPSAFRAFLKVIEEET